MAGITIPVQFSIQGMLKRLIDDNIYFIHGSGPPISGASPFGTGAPRAGIGTYYVDKVTGCVYINESARPNVYWTPVSFDQRGLLGNYTDFRSGLGSPIAGTNDGDVIADGTGVRVHGQGMAEIDSGMTVAFAEDGPVASLICTDEVAHSIGLSHAGTSPWFQPNTHGPLTIDVTVAMSSAITLRRLFVGFVGLIPDALDPPVTGSTVTATLVQDDLAGFGFDVGFTDPDRLYAYHNKSDEAASQSVLTGGRDTLVDFPAAGTYTRLRVQITAAGVMTCFKDKVPVARITAALDVDEEIAPTVTMSSTSTATKTMLLRQAAWWGSRNT